MSTAPRNPRYFPKMKVRGARRKRLATFQIVVGSFDRLIVATEQAELNLRLLEELLQKEEA